VGTDQIEVGQLGIAVLVEHDVDGFDIAVDHAAGVAFASASPTWTMSASTLALATRLWSTASRRLPPGMSSMMK